MKRFAFVPLVMLALAAACDRSPAAVRPPAAPGLDQATTFTISREIPVTLSGYLPCGGDSVTLSGELHDLYDLTVNGNTVLFNALDNPQGVSGYGIPSGDLYHAAGDTQFELESSLDNTGQLQLTFIDNFDIIGQNTGNDFLVHITEHIAFDANGDLTAEVANTSIQCK